MRLSKIEILKFALIQYYFKNSSGRFLKFLLYRKF
nr:MAG TPA: hypothetical protein [Caudoviricetes sp.]